MSRTLPLVTGFAIAIVIGIAGLLSGNTFWGVLAFSMAGLLMNGLIEETVDRPSNGSHDHLTTKNSDVNPR